MDSYDVAIVGNGILGLSSALELARADPNLKIAVIGPGDRPGAASSAAGAMLGCFGELSHRTLASAPGRAKHELSMQALDAWPEWLSQLNSDLPATDRLAMSHGTYLILNSRGGRLDSYNFQAILDALRDYDRKFEDVAFADVPGLHPSMDVRPLRALYLPDEGAVDARNVLAAIASVTARLGVAFLDEQIVGWETDGDRATAAVAASGTVIRADRYLVAAGSYTGALLRDLADDAAPLPPVLAGKGVAVSCQRAEPGSEHVVRTPNRAGGCGLHMVPGQDGMVYLGATNDLLLQPDTSPTLGMAHFLMGCAVEQLDNRLFQSRVVQWHVGNRPGTLDGSPLIGKVWQDNVWTLCGTYRDGFHCSPVLARHMADVMLGGPGTLGDHPFTPIRKPLRAMSQQDAIEEVALHCVSQFYEFAAQPPTYMRVAEGIDRQVRVRTRQTYEKLETDIGLAPEVLELLNWGPHREAALNQFRDYFKRTA